MTVSMIITTTDGKADGSKDELILKNEGGTYQSLMRFTAIKGGCKMMLHTDVSDSTKAREISDIGAGAGATTEELIAVGIGDQQWLGLRSAMDGQEATVLVEIL